MAKALPFADRAAGVKPQNEKDFVEGEGIVSIELAVGAAAFVLGARLFALIQATRGVPDAHGQLLEALTGGDLGKVQKKARGLGYRTPYADMAGLLIEASQREAESAEERRKMLDRAAGVARRRFIRRTQQGQAMDLVAFAVGFGIIAFARSALPAGPVFWSLGGAVMTLLLSSLVARAKLRASVLGSLESLRGILETRPQLPSLSDGPIDCFWCGSKTDRKVFDVREKDAPESVHVLGAFCGECGKLVLTMPLEEDADSTISSADHPIP
jgi:hypothetical protein